MRDARPPSRLHALARTSGSVRCRSTPSRRCPAIQRLAGPKGHLVREIDALGGAMGEAIDATGLQFRLLNRSRGAAVRSPRAQADKRLYAAWMRAFLEHQPNIEWIIGPAGRILVSAGRVAGLALEGGDRYPCEALVVTTGTFLNGLIHVGPEQIEAGRAGEPASRELARSLMHLGFERGRLKTGTPPRLARESIDFSKTEVQHGDAEPGVCRRHVLDWRHVPGWRH